jgi:hypothetical protein
MKRNVLNVSRWPLLAGSALAALVLAPLSSRGEGPNAFQLSRAAVEPTPSASTSVFSSAAHEHPPMVVTWHALDTFEQMNSASTLVVRARVLNHRRGMLRSYGWHAQENRFKTPQEAGSEFVDTPLTISTLSVIEVVRGGAGSVALGGRPLAERSTIELVELGGTLPDGCFNAPGDKPVLRDAEEGVFFLTPAERPGAYNVVGGWQGRMGIRGGKIHALASDTHPSAEQFTRYTGRDVASFVDEVRRMPVQKP